MCEPLDKAGPPFRLTMPSRWANAGRVRCRRSFGYPGRIDQHERVWLTLSGVADRAQVSLNGTYLGTLQGATPVEFDVSNRLCTRNEVVVDVEASGESAGLWGEVALEVRCTAFLRAVRSWVELQGSARTLNVAGEVVGGADGPLDLYVILDRSPLVEAQIEATPAGQAFHLRVDISDPSSLQEAQQVRVDLVNAATIWYSMDVAIRTPNAREA